jgi:hypothetical protein
VRRAKTPGDQGQEADGRSRRQGQTAGADGRSRKLTAERQDFPFLIFHFSFLHFAN